MNAKLPKDAFAFYVALAGERSYETVAKHFNVAKRTVVRTASRDNWAGRLEAIEKKTRELTDAKLATDMHDMQLRHQKIVRAMASRAVKALAEYPLNSGMEGARVAELAIKLERLLAGEPSERNQVSIETITKRELERFVAPAKGSAEDDGEPDGDEW